MRILVALISSAAWAVSPSVDWVPATWSTESHGCGSGAVYCPDVSLSWTEVLTANALLAEGLRTWIDAAILANPVEPGLLPTPQDVGRVVEEEIGSQGGNAFLTREVRVLYQDRRCASLVAIESSYTGGAHPNASQRRVTFDVASGEKVTLASMLADDGMETLLEHAEKVFRTQQGLDEEASLSSGEFVFTGDVFVLPANWSVVEAGLVLFYNTHEIGPYVVGQTEITVPMEDLAEITRPGSVLDRVSR